MGDDVTMYQVAIIFGLITQGVGLLALAFYVGKFVGKVTQMLEDHEQRLERGGL